MKTLLITLLLGAGMLTVAQNYTPIELFPNPATDRIFVQVPPSFLGITNIYVSDINGRIFSTVELNLSEQDQALLRRVELPLNGLTTGYYILNIRNGNDWRAEKFVKR